MRPGSLLLVLALLGCGGTAEGAAEEAAVREVFQAYRQALQAGDGDRAADLVTEGTIQRYQEWRDLALKGTREEVLGGSLLHRMQVVLIRSRVEPEVLAGFTGADLFRHAVAQGWIGKDAAVRTSLGEVEVSGARASAGALVDGEPAGQRWQFVREGDAWKLDLEPFLEASEIMFRELARRQGMEEDEFVLSVAETLSGKRLDDSIWDPIE